MLGTSLGAGSERRVLPCTFHPGEDELLSSWLVRLAWAHRIKVESFCRHLWPQVTLWKRDMDKVAPAVVLETLADRTLTPRHRILQTTLASVSEQLNGVPLLTGQGHTSWLMPLRIHHRTHQGHGLVYCPRCLQQDGANPYYRKSWRLAFHVACLTCGIYMQEGCPACGASITFFRLDIGRSSTNATQSLSTCYQCAFDLRQAPTRPVSSQDLSRYQALYSISSAGWNAAVPFPHQYFQVLRQLVRVLSCPFGRARVLQVDMRLRLGQPVEWLSGGGAYEQLPITERTYLLEQAMWLLTDWPNRFINVMHYHQIKKFVLLRDMTGQVPFWFDSVVTEQFCMTKTNRRLMPPVPPRAAEACDPLIAPFG